MFLISRLIQWLRGVRERAAAKNQARALAWASEHYPTEPLKGIAVRFIVILKEQVVSCRMERCFPRSDFYKDLKMWDLQDVELFMALEEEFRVEFKETAVERFRTIDGCIRYLAERIEAKGKAVEQPPRENHAA